MDEVHQRVSDIEHDSEHFNWQRVLAFGGEVGKVNHPAKLAQPLVSGFEVLP